ncbi:MAG: glutamate--tRNA ligase [Patescibacteria group bacterium UBA2163]
MPQFVSRFAPSPTGLLHAGNYRTAVFAYLFARHNDGTFVLRIEDTDKKRSETHYAENIMETLDWLGLEYDALRHQSECVEEHERVLRDFVDRGIAYVSKETSEDGSQKELIRFKNPNKKITFTDVVRGDITVDTTDLGDFVIAKGFDAPLFHLAVVVDDAVGGITHVIRGEDHISNTPRQILIYEAINAHIPQYVHLPLVLAQDRSKLSKRKGARALLEYRDLGYLPDAILNYLTMLGWHPGTDEEVFTKEQLIERFTLQQIQKSGAIFDEVKLRWFNREHILRLDPKEFSTKIKEWLSKETYTKLSELNRFEAILPVIRERIEIFADVKTMETAGEFAYFVETPHYTPEELLWKKEPSLAVTKTHLQKAYELLSAVSQSEWDVITTKEALWDYASEVGRGNVLWPVRFALTGKEKSPDPFTVAAILGKDETLARITHAITHTTT